jgi:hypothetical protein
MWTMSGEKLRRAETVRAMVAGKGETGARDPFTEIGRLLPTGKNLAPCKLSASTRPAVSAESAGPITTTSSPFEASARAKPRTWVWTPPGTVQL